MQNMILGLKRKYRMNFDQIISPNNHTNTSYGRRQFAREQKEKAKEWKRKVRNIHDSGRCDKRH